MNRKALCTAAKRLSFIGGLLRMSAMPSGRLRTSAQAGDALAETNGRLSI